MGSATRPRGRLPQRVYWVRRAVVLVVGLLLVLGIGKLVGGLGSDPAATATRASTTTTPQSTAAAPATSSTAPAPVGPVAPSRKSLRSQGAAPLATPSGPCRVSDVSVLPTVPQAPGGGDIPIILQLVGTEPACTFEVSAKTVAVKITKGDSTFWTSWQCPAAVPETQVVVRSGVPAAVPVSWNGRASDDECSNRTQWAVAGRYHVYASAKGSTPQDLEFQVTDPQRPVRTRTVKPKPAERSPGASASPSATPTGSPKG